MAKEERYVLKKQLNNEETLIWEQFLHKLFLNRSYYLMNFKNKYTYGIKKRIRIYLETLEIRKEEKRVIYILGNYIPKDWKLQKEIKTSTECNKISNILKKPFQNKIKKRIEWFINKENIRFTLDRPGNFLEIKAKNIKILLEFIEKNDYMFNEI